MKLLKTVFFSLILILVFSACKNKKNTEENSENFIGNEIESNLENKKITIITGISKGIAGLPFMYFENGYADSDAVVFNQQFFSTKEELLKAFFKGQIHVAVFSITDALKIYNQDKEKTVCLGIICYGSGAVVSSNPDLTEEKLKDQTVYGGAEKSWLCTVYQNTISGGKSDHSIPVAELCSRLVSGQIQYALLEQPLVSIALSKNQELSAGPYIGKDLPQYVLIADSTFVKENEAQFNYFLEQLNFAAEWSCFNTGDIIPWALKKGLVVVRTGVDVLFESETFKWTDKSEAKSRIEKFFDLVHLEKPESQFYFSPSPQL